ncbi:VOC family protein [Kitasatospora sp. NPDC006697]|uniref:VOC family protein n=1 Tax=Kitasatospora sp. NPDC006697 TaxID=3364020 RepID=UPI0036C0A393
MADEETQERAVQDRAVQERAPMVWPTFRARDARGMIRFLAEAFGFEENVVYGEGELVHHAELDWPEGGGVMLGSVRGDDSDKGLHAPGHFSAYVVTDHPDAVHDRAKAAGARITTGLHETEYGSRDFAATDPEGNHWYFGTYRGAPRRG